jgi:uncharacterized protein (TIGR02145 family)
LFLALKSWALFFQKQNENDSESFDFKPFLFFPIFDFEKSTFMKNLFILLLVVIIGTGTATFSQTVTIGTQEWMTKNLDVSTFRNGDPIPEAKTNSEWEMASKNKQPAWCYYNNDPQYGEKYGKLYNWYAVTDPRGLAPVGYHIPSDEEWTVLINQLGGNSPAGIKMKSKTIYETKVRYEDEGGYYENEWIPCGACSYWTPQQRANNPCTVCRNEGGKSVKGKYIPKTKKKIEEQVIGDGWDGTNESGFSGLAGGMRLNLGGFLYCKGVKWTPSSGYGVESSGQWWSSTMDDTPKNSPYELLPAAWSRGINDANFYVERKPAGLGYGLSVRCIGGEQRTLDSLKRVSDSLNQIAAELDKSIQDFRIEFDTKFGGLVDKFALNPEQWDRMYDTKPETYPPTSFSVLSSITENIVSYIGKYYASSEFGLFKQVLGTFIELYGDKVDDKGNETKILDPSFFERFGGTVDQVKGLYDSITAKNNEVKDLINYDFLSDPDDQLDVLFAEVIVTVLETPESYFSKPLKMKAFRYTRMAPIPDIDLSPINKVLDGPFDQPNCLSVLDVFGKYQFNIFVPKDLIHGLATKGQKCLCEGYYENLDKLSFKEKFNRKMKELVKKRLATYRNMGISINDC